MSIIDKEALVALLEAELERTWVDTPGNPFIDIDEKILHRGWNAYSKEVHKRTGKYVVQFEFLNLCEEFKDMKKIP